MGTDIELFAEEQRVDGWHFVGEMGPNTWPMTEAEEIEPARRPLSQYDSRNRALFHLLGFDGHGAHEAQRLPMIAPLRGLPPNLSPEIQAWRRYSDGDRPPGGWLLLKEVLAFPWDRARRKEAMVSPRVAPLFAPNAPFPYAQWPADERMGYSTYQRGGVTVQWTETYRESAGSFLSDLAIPLSQRHPLSVIRFVFWFCS
jgi:hypothetical protein